MSPRMLRDLSVLFSLEAIDADERGDPIEADRLWDAAEDLHNAAQVRLEELVR